MAAIDVGTGSPGRKLERMLLGCALLAAAVVEAANGRGQAVFAGALAALALYLLASRHDAALDRRQSSILAAVDFLAVAALAALCDPSGVLWRAPTSIENLFLLTPSGAGTAVFLYLTGSVGLTGRSPLAIRAALFALPFLFCLLVALGSPVAVELGRAALFGFEAPEFVNTVVGRVLVLFLVNEAVVVGAPLALGRFLPREWRPHGVLFLAALYAAVTPYIATAVSAYVTPWAPTPIAQIAAVLAAALAQAGLWGETYLVTQSLAGLLRGSASLSVIVFGDWKSGAEKGLVYGLVFMGLLLGANLILGFTPAVAVIHATGPLGARDSWRAAVSAGARHRRKHRFDAAVLWPARSRICAKLEFRARRRGWGRRSGWPFISTCRAGAGSIGFCSGRPWAPWRSPASTPRSTLSNCARSAGSIFAAGASMRSDPCSAAWSPGPSPGTSTAARSRPSSRNSMPMCRSTIAPTDARSTPMSFVPYSPNGARRTSAWPTAACGFSIDESLSGVIQWVFAAPLFSINMFFLTALVQRSLKPLRQLASFEGLDLLIENAVRVLRWGLWMAPVIYSFLKASPDPTWYNQDGLMRTGVATWLNSTLPDNEFRQWSLDIFTALLAYDGLRVLIWFDHMGLRVATLVNLSFVGGDIADEKAARFLGKAQISRAIPEGIRRFGTWAPLLLPFYIPRGAEWDKAWSGAEQMTHMRPPSYLYLVSGYLVYAGVLALALIVFLLDATRARRQIAAGRRHRRGRRAGVASAAAHQWPDDERMVRGRAGRDPHRGRRARRSADRSHAPSRRSRPSARSLPVPARRRRRPCGRSGRRRTCGVGVKATLTDEGDNRLFFQCRQQGFDIEARVALASERSGGDDAAEARSISNSARAKSCWRRCANGC